MNQIKYTHRGPMPRLANLLTGKVCRVGQATAPAHQTAEEKVGQRGLPATCPTLHFYQTNRMASPEANAGPVHRLSPVAYYLQYVIDPIGKSRQARITGVAIPTMQVLLHWIRRPGGKSSLEHK